MVEYTVLGEIPDSSREHAFTKRDYEFLDSTSGVEKAKRTLSKSPYDFHFIIAKGSFATLAMIPEIVHKAFPKGVSSPGKITAVYTNNITNKDQYFPLNGWILIHRIAHMIQLERTHRYLEQEAMMPLAAFASRVLGEDVPYVQSVAMKPSKMYDMARLLMTMRSARIGEIHTQLDIFAELLAQYVVTGRITLNRYEHWRGRHQLMIDKAALERQMLYSKGIRNVKGYTKLENYQDIASALEKLIDSSGRNCTIGELNTEITALEDSLNSSMKSVLDQMVGKYFVW